MLKRVLIFFLSQILLIGFVQSQSKMDSLPVSNTDSVIVTDTVSVTTDPVVLAFFSDSVSVNTAVSKEWVFKADERFLRQWIQKIYKLHLFYNFKKPQAQKKSDLKQFFGKEAIFYALIGLVLAFAIFKRMFTKYFKDLFRLFFRTTLKYSQISEQLLQNLLPSLLMNLFFVVSGAFYVTTLLFHFKISPIDNFWLALLNAAGLIAVVYLVKYMVLKISGLLFDIKTATDSYIFIVFIVNKIISIYLLPFIILISFSDGMVQQVAITLSWMGLAGLVLYRFILSYGSIRNLVKVNPFHFFLYLSAFEIAPLLILYKLMLFFI